MSESRKRGTTHRPAGVSDHGSTSIHGRRGIRRFLAVGVPKAGTSAELPCQTTFSSAPSGHSGYDVDQMDLEGVIPPAIRVRDVYLGLERDAAVVARAQQLLEHPTPSLRADDRNYLAQLAAVATPTQIFVRIFRPINASIRWRRRCAIGAFTPWPSIRRTYEFVTG
jgi:hypothetical protein